MNAEDRERQLAQTQFAGQLRSQFKALGEQAQQPRKRRRVVVGAVAAGVAAIIMLGGVALAGGFHSDRPQPGPTEEPAAVPGGMSLPLAPATSVYPTNANGQTYGTVRPMVQESDLVAATATNGRVGYCLNTDLGGPAPRTPAEALHMHAAASGKDRVIPVYESDGTTQIGVFVIGVGGGTVTETVASPPDWLLKEMSGLARNAGDAKASAWWTLTTAEKAAVVEGEDAPSSVSNPDRAVYVVVMHGDFTNWLWSLLSNASRPAYSWIFELIDADSHLVDVTGTSARPFDRSGLDMQSVVLSGAGGE